MSLNRKALYDYAILETYEAGLVLTGTEIKSIRAGRANIRESYAAPINKELWLYNMHIPPYEQGGLQNHIPTRPRKLLLHRDQLTRVIGESSQRRLTLIPLRLIIKNRVAKIELALAKGKRQYEKRETIRDREINRELAREIRREI